MAKNLVIVVVPGGLGTKLSLEGTRVWDFDLAKGNVAGARMIFNPALLLPWLPLEHGAPLSAYDDLRKFFANHGYVKNDSLFLWGYDWRLGMEANAQALADFVTNEIALKGRKLLFVAHSSGCMIVRWALLFGTGGAAAPMIDNALVDTVVAAGPPMLGMARPFKDVVDMPRVVDAFDDLFKLVQAVYPTMANQLSIPISNSLMAVTAQLEGLTPNNLPILSGGSGFTGVPFGAFDWTGWPSELATLHATVRATHIKLQAKPWGTVNCAIIASQDHPTETGYKLDGNDQYKSDWSLLPGDDSVLLTSAQAYCPSVAPVLVKERHRTLLDDPNARNYLATII